MHHAASRETAAVSGGRTTDGIPRAVGPLQLTNSHCKQGPQDAGSPPTVTGTPPAMSSSHADIISFWKGHLLHLEGTKEPTRTHCCPKVQLCSCVERESQKIFSITNIYLKKKKTTVARGIAPVFKVVFHGLWWKHRCGASRWHSGYALSVLSICKWGYRVYDTVNQISLIKQDWSSARHNRWTWCCVDSQVIGLPAVIRSLDQNSRNKEPGTDPGTFLLWPLIY